MWCGRAQCASKVLTVNPWVQTFEEIEEKIIKEKTNERTEQTNRRTRIAGFQQRNETTKKKPFPWCVFIYMRKQHPDSFFECTYFFIIGWWLIVLQLRQWKKANTIIFWKCTTTHTWEANGIIAIFLILPFLPAMHRRENKFSVILRILIALCISVSQNRYNSKFSTFKYIHNIERGDILSENIIE